MCKGIIKQIYTGITTVLPKKEECLNSRTLLFLYSNSSMAEDEEQEWNSSKIKGFSFGDDDEVL